MNHEQFLELMQRYAELGRLLPTEQEIFDDPAKRADAEMILAEMAALQRRMASRVAVVPEWITDTELPLGRRLAPETLAAIEDTARRVPEDKLDAFFADVAAQLRPIPVLHDSDVKHACAAAFVRAVKPKAEL